MYGFLFWGRCISVEPSIPYQTGIPRPNSIWLSQPASSVPASQSRMLFSEFFASAYMVLIVRLLLSGGQIPANWAADFEN